MGNCVYFYDVLVLFNSILSGFDQWMFSNFGISTSLIDNGEQVVVSVFALIIISFLVILVVGNSSKKNNLENLDANETPNLISRSLSEHVPSLASADNSSENTVNQTKDVNDVNDVTQPIEPSDAVIQDDLKVSEKPNIYELDNGFVINRRSADTEEVVNVDGIGEEEQKKTEKDAIEPNVAPLSAIVSGDKKIDVSVELATIEQEMLGVRKDFKSGEIGSLDYFTKTQELYKKGEILVESAKLFD